jgi:hypothetical protein
MAVVSWRSRIGGPGTSSDPSPPPTASSLPAPPLLAGKSYRALMAAPDAGRALRLLLHRDDAGAWAFEEPLRSLLPQRGSFADDSHFTAMTTAGQASFRLHSRRDRSVEFLPEHGDDKTTLVDNVPWSATSFDSGFDVRIGSIDARAQLHRSGRTLQGFYRYANSRSDLELAGRIEEDGHFTMAERTGKCVVTGRWEGVFLSASSAAGEWSSLDGKKRYVFGMAAGGHLARYEPDEFTVEAVHEEDDAGAGCTNERTYPKVSGPSPASRNAKLNDALLALVKDSSSVSCDGTEPNLPYSSHIEVSEIARAPGYLSVSVTGSEYLGGAHGMYGVSCALFDTRTGEPVNLTEVFGPRAMAAMLAEVQKDVVEYWKENKLEEFYASSLPKDLDDARVCYEGADKIEVGFNPYRVAPYMAGPVSFDIDVEQLLRLVPRSPAAAALFGESATRTSAPACPPPD